MKRSEMVAILEKLINDQLHQDDKFETELVSDILLELEKFGMIPPVYLDFCKCENKHTYCCSQNNYYPDGTPNHDWEEE